MESLARVDEFFKGALLCFYILVYNADYYFTDVILFPIYFYIEKTSMLPNNGWFADCE